MALTLKYYKKNEKAWDPYKAHGTDAGWDLTVMERIQKPTKENNHIEIWDTGLVLIPPEGYHTELVARSSLYKKGRMLANSIGVIDPTYTGTVKVVFYCFGECDDEDLQSHRLVQVLLRKTNNCKIKEVDEIDMTERGEGGFGSTGTKN